MLPAICPLRMELRQPENVTDQVFIARSGHRVAVDDKYLYCWGGYNSEFWEVENTEHTAYPLFNELWRYQNWTGEWKLLETRGEVPSQLASHSLVKIQNHLLHFGGNGVPFGMTNTNCVYDLDLETLKWRILLKPNDDTGEDPEYIDKNIPRATYGQSMTHIGNCIYIVGGSCDFVYDCDVHRLDMCSLEWEVLPVKSKYTPEGRYRHEVIYYEGKLLMFGGGAEAGYTAFSLSKIDVFDLDEQTWENIATIPSERRTGETTEAVYPGSRRCHSCTQFKDDVYVCGGLDPDSIKGDLWKFHLPSYQWTALQVPLPLPVYFHSAAVSNDGCMFIFGGVTKVDYERTNALQIMWLHIPPLNLLAWNSVIKCLNLKQCKQNYQTLRNLGIPRHYLDLVL